MTKKVSIKDIAAGLNVSTTTVSFILNGKGKEKGISDVLTERVLKYVKEIGYTTNQLAKSLRTGKTNIISLLIENIDDPFFSSIAGYVEEVANQRGYKIIYGSTRNETDKTRELINLFKDRHVDGFIITPAENMEVDIMKLKNEGIPFVLFDRYCESVLTDYVGMDNLDSSRKAVEHLISRNHKNIGFITLNSDQSQMFDRLRGYEEAVTSHNLNVFVKKIDYSKVHQVAVKEITAFMKENPQIDALFFATSYLALKGLEVLNNLNLSIPGDVGLIAFDDHEIFKLYKPTITAVTQPVAEMSKQLVNLLLKQIDSEGIVPQQPEHIIVPSVINIRKSSV
jgi:LacI family transcriptional regulator